MNDCPKLFQSCKMSRHKNVSRDGDETIHLWGKEAIEEQINEVTFDLSPRAFFQLNPQQTELLYGEGIKALDVQPNETIVDAYCGVGTIGLSVAKQAKEVREWIPFLKQSLMQKMRKD